MIFYFSATGNCKHTAERIADEGETLIFIPDAVKAGIYDYSVTDGHVGIISPTYNWTLPSIVSEFLAKLTLSFDIKPYIFFVATFGTTSGTAVSDASKILKSRGYAPDAVYDIRMPDTWTPTFDLSDPEHVKSILEKSEAEIDEVKKLVSERYHGRHLHMTTPAFTGIIGRRIYDGNTRLTSHFKVNETCIGCGLCAKKCPVSAIEMRDRRPVWVKDRCVMCLGCLHRCPKFAIQYGKNTSKHGQYMNPYTKI